MSQVFEDEMGHSPNGYVKLKTGAMDFAPMCGWRNAKR
jgi:hypothetical protein